MSSGKIRRKLSIRSKESLLAISCLEVKVGAHLIKEDKIIKALYKQSQVQVARADVANGIDKDARALAVARGSFSFFLLLESFGGKLVSSASKEGVSGCGPHMFPGPYLSF